MNTFVLVSFWLNIFSVVISFAILSTSEFPRKRDTETMGFRVAMILLAAAYACWSGYLLWII